MYNQRTTRYTVPMKQRDGSAASANGSKWEFKAESNGNLYVGKLVQVVESRHDNVKYRLQFADGTSADVKKTECTRVDNSVDISSTGP